MTSMDGQSHRRNTSEESPKTAPGTAVRYFFQDDSSVERGLQLETWKNRKKIKRCSPVCCVGSGFALIPNGPITIKHRSLIANWTRQRDDQLTGTPYPGTWFFHTTWRRIDALWRPDRPVNFFKTGTKSENSPRKQVVIHWGSTGGCAHWFFLLEIHTEGKRVVFQWTLQALNVLWWFSVVDNVLRKCATGHCSILALPAGFPQNDLWSLQEEQNVIREPSDEWCRKGVLACPRKTLRSADLRLETFCADFRRSSKSPHNGAKNSLRSSILFCWTLLLQPWTLDKGMLEIQARRAPGNVVLWNMLFCSMKAVVTSSQENLPKKDINVHAQIWNRRLESRNHKPTERGCHGNAETSRG